MSADLSVETPLPGTTTLGTLEDQRTVAQKRSETRSANRSHPRFRVGDQIRCQREARSRGSWPRFDGRTGTVIEINSGEIGVAFTPKGDRAEAWFLPTELVHISEVTA